MNEKKNNSKSLCKKLSNQGEFYRNRKLIDHPNWLMLKSQQEEFITLILIGCLIFKIVSLT